ncbi:maestro heat-like repeat-containing protein family member 6 isoform X2 [Manacus candei]|uniref:maestro heat-like repeat-containing protein family member 6 isoform X1 n=1 Tax=Manacus candei TaxID=415023 RepID=UPI002226B2C5|nr:maestro heat-like repeat-containing protein family member 6 isoform X1 [Manacus candei]XP_051628090.1 maestro heat-like repeat-containing protein family member 6 isoform X2 [Manacus candei]XP_051628091.1 maestro heat-like repeat-containing protein family member 6 isoform X2 [Manacus candei]
MAGGCFGLCRLLRRKRKNRRGPGAGPAQEAEEEVQHFQPLQQDPGRDRPEEQDRARGRLRRAVQRLLKFVGVRRRTATTAPPELTAQPDTSAAELEAEPDVSTARSDCAASGDMALTDCTATSDMAVTDGTDTTTMAAIDCAANCDTALVDGTDTSDQTLVNGTANSDMAPVEGTEATDTAPLEATATSDTALTDGTATFDTALTDAETSSDTAPTDVGAKADATTESIADTDCLPMDSVTDAPSLDIWEEKTVSNVNEVPAIVRSIHQWLTCRVSPEVRPPIAIRRLAHAHPGHVVTTLLHCAPACDRAAAILWRTIASSATTAHEVLPTLLGVMEDWPLHSVCTSNGDHVDVFALAATLALWLMVQELQCQDALFVYAPRLLLALLCQVSMSTEQMPQEVSTFWRGCQELHGLPTHPNSFVVQTIRALLCRLQWDQELVSVERKRGWDALLSADTHHYAVGLLAREMRHVLVPSYGPLARHLLGLLSTEGPRWELPALAFLVEVLNYLDVSAGDDSVLQILARHLQSQCPERRRLALRGLLVLSGDPSMAKSICSLSEPLLELLRDGDGELVRMTLSLFLNVLQDEEDRKGLSSTAPRLTEALRPVFDNDNSHVQLLSIRLFREVMEVLAEEGTEPWEMQVRQSLVPLFFRWHDENQRVAEAAREALLWATSFLKRKDLEQLLKTEQPFRFCDCLMEKDRSRRGEHLQQALPYLQSPQEPLREAAVRFMGVAGWHMREWQQDLWPILKGLTAMSDDDCPSVSNIRTALMDTYSRARRRPMSLQQPRNSPGTTSRHGCTTS